MPGQLVWSGGSDHYIPTVLSSPAWFGGQHSHVYTEGKDKVNQVEASQVEYTPAPSPPPGELTLEYIKHAYPHLFEGLGELGPPFSFSLNSEV